MTFDIDKIIESKRVMRSRLVALPIAEKLRMLDDMRERELSLRASRTTQSLLTSDNNMPEQEVKREQ